MTLKTFTSSVALALFLGSSAFAQGGNDPIPGIDIIIKRDPGSQPIQSGQFGERQIGLAYNADIEKLNARLRELVGQTIKMNDLAEDKNVRAFAEGNAIYGMSKDLSSQVSEGQAGQSSFTFPSADGKSKMTVTIRIRGDEELGEPMDARGNPRIGQELLDVPMGDMIRERAPAGCVTEAGDVDANCNGVSDAAEGESKPQPAKANTYGTTRSNRNTAITESKPPDVKN